MMKTFVVSLFLLCCLTVVFPQVPTERVEISPPQPIAGGPVTILYALAGAPAYAAAAGTFQLEMFVLPASSGLPGLRNVAMSRAGDYWKATFDAPDDARFLAFRFVAGDSVDDNGENVWTAIILDAAKRPVRGAHAALATMHQYGWGSFRKTRDAALMKENLRKELELYPDSWEAAVALWSAELGREPSEEAKATVRKGLDAFYERDRSDDALCARYPAWYERVGDSAKARAIRSEWVAKSPTGKTALEARHTAARGVEDQTKLVALYRAILKEFPALDDDARQSELAMLLRSAMRVPDADAIVEAVEAMPKPASYNLTQAAAKLVAAKRFDDAERFARRAVEMTEKPDPSDRVYYKTAKEWEENAAYNRSSSLQGLAEVYLAQGKFDDAAEELGAAYLLTKGEDPDIDQLFVQALSGSGKAGRALDIGFEAYAHGKGSDSLVADLRRAFAASEGAASFDALPKEKAGVFEGRLASAHAAMVAEVRAKVLKSRIDQESFDFTLNNLSGAPVHLAELKGKVVIVDFWATWCGPCRSSFPFLKKVFERYRENPDVVILAVDCWERQKDLDATIANAKKFMADNKYEWTVLIDGKNEVVEQYGVEGIPTKFILGRNGRVAFKEVGFNGPEMVEQMVQQIEILLSEPSLGMNQAR